MTIGHKHLAGSTCKMQQIHAYILVDTLTLP